ncbi:MAG TPA: hypothetical protein VG826_18830 [Pirellulales bacterium]|nr:hypothetical protein [Pirellulales bacterium]
MNFEWRFDWQDVVALAVVFAAAASLARRAWRKMSARPAVGCTHCAACPSGRQKQFVTVSLGIAESTSGDPLGQHGP